MPAALKLDLLEHPHVASLDAHAALVGAGHKVALVTVALRDGQVLRYFVAAPLLKNLAEKLAALARALGEEPDEHYRALKTEPYANGRQAYTKWLPPLPLREDNPTRAETLNAERLTSNAEVAEPTRINGHDLERVDSVEESSTHLSREAARGAFSPGSEARGPVGPRGISDAQIDAAYRDYITSGDTLNQVGDRHGFSGGALSARLIARYGRGYALRARRAQQNGPAAVAALLASAGEPEAAPITKPSGAIL